MKITPNPDFEQHVLRLLSIKQSKFNQCVQEHRGYALLLRHWIIEAYQKGTSVHEVATMISNSHLSIDKIREGKPLSFKDCNMSIQRYIPPTLT
ncbi:hypothetical protein [Aquimarina algicola]|uniref:Uncharacterized protein n=1 Tax=Aquimarina algicola TaxID=2589995 RepID=A0A504IZ96_9FLAO|nr:hypothetical protein [Aquimarina algicola]TPN83857.1 hypothetical protein FHK87_17985 [Aquimarina algicola]